MRKALHTKLFGLEQHRPGSATLKTICQDISDALFDPGQDGLTDHELAELVMNLDPKWQDMANIPDVCIAPMRGMGKAQFQVYIRQNFPEEFIRMYHQIIGLAPVSAGGEPTSAGVYSVSYPGGLRYRASPNSDNCVAAIAHPSEHVTIIRVQSDPDGREMGLVQETQLWLPTRLASGETVLTRIAGISLETRISMDEDTAYTHTDEYTYTDDMSVMSNMSNGTEECESPTPFTMPFTCCAISIQIDQNTSSDED